ncbi:cyclase family protein [Nocardiopsis baichengensis]|uniref:cyclase family protein n=1 Tax=Nocardiopsis baichengensis TaxID=280240 RepID=UPI00034655C5|nr:cyclase family protein [Nocardiopsis baichengensis]
MATDPAAAGGARVIDLSHPVGPGTQVFPGDTPPVVSPACTLAADGYNSVRLDLGSHTGTHADAPYHFLSDGPRLGDLPLELFTGPAVVVDATGLAPRTPIGPEAFGPWEDRLEPGAVVLVRTGWDRHYGTEAYYDHPYLSGAAARLLVARGVRTVGLDTLSPDETPYAGRGGEDWSAHLAVLGAGGTVIENLRGLAAADAPGARFCAFPLRLESGDGAPVRAVALLGDAS